MVVLAIILFVSAQTDSYAIAGIMTAAFQLSASSATIVSSRIADRLGQSRVLPVLCLGNALFTVGFVVSIRADTSLLISGMLIAAAGAFMPAIGSMVRARWASLTEGERLRTAFAMESTLDEVDWTVGPLLTALLAAMIDPAAPLLAAAAMTVLFGLALAVQRSTQPVPRPTHTHAHRVSVLRTGLPVVVVTLMGVGFMFGAYEVAVPAFAREVGAPNASGLVLSAWAIGSMVGGLWFGARRWKVSLPTQAQWTIGVMSVAVLPGILCLNLALATAAAFVAGVAIAPSLITQFSLAERLVPIARITEGITWAMSGITIGFAAGSALAGMLIDGWGVRAGFATAILGAVAALAVAWSCRRYLDRRVHPGTEPIGYAPNIEPIPGPSA